MARIRTVKPEFWTDSKTGTLSDRATKLFIGMFNHADDEGVLEFDLMGLKAKIFPYLVDPVSEVIARPLLEEILPRRLAIILKLEGRCYLFICNFAKHQVINRPSRPVIPNFSADDAQRYEISAKEAFRGSIINSVGTHGALTEYSVSTHARKGKERKGREGKGEEGNITPTGNGSTEVNEKNERKPTTIQQLVAAYKVAKGIPRDDKGWDKANFARYAKAAVSLLEAFGGDVKKAAMYLIVQGQDWDAAGVSWTLETITRHAWDNRAKIMPQEEKTDGLENRALNDGRDADKRSTRRITRAGELAGRALEEIRDAIPRVGGQDFPDELSEA